MTAFLEEIFRMRLLEIAAANFSGWNLRGDAEYGNARAVTVEQAVDEVQVARSAAAGANRELTREMGFGAGRERGDLLVPDMDPFDFAVTAYGVRQAVQTIADNAVDPLDTRYSEGLDELICHCSSHDFPHHR